MTCVSSQWSDSLKKSIRPTGFSYNCTDETPSGWTKRNRVCKKCKEVLDPSIMVSRKQAEKTTAGQTPAISYPKGRRTRKSAPKAQRWEPKPQAAVLSPEQGTTSIICPRGVFYGEFIVEKFSHVPKVPSL